MLNSLPQSMIRNEISTFGDGPNPFGSAKLFKLKSLSVSYSLTPHGVQEHLQWFGLRYRHSVTYYYG